MTMSAKHTIPEIVENETKCIMVPCVYDCASARAAELAGYQAILLSGGEVGEILGSITEEEMTEEELFFMASHICEFSPLPLIIDCGCFNPAPTSVHRWAKKFANAGAMALLIEDEDDIGEEDFLNMVKAALHGCKGTKCIVIARSNRRLTCEADIEYVARILNRAVDLGAYMTMACGLNTMEKACCIAKKVKGPKFYPDQNSHNGKAEVVNEEIFEMGYSMISFHYTLKVAMAAMIDYGIKDLAAGNNIPSNEVKFYNGMSGHSALPMFDYQGKFDREALYTGKRKIFKIPGEEID